LVENKPLQLKFFGIHECNETYFLICYMDYGIVKKFVYAIRLLLRVVHLSSANFMYQYKIKSYGDGD